VRLYSAVAERRRRVLCLFRCPFAFTHLIECDICKFICRCECYHSHLQSEPHKARTCRRTCMNRRICITLVNHNAHTRRRTYLHTCMHVWLHVCEHVCVCMSTGMSERCMHKCIHEPVFECTHVSRYITPGPLPSSDASTMVCYRMNCVPN
jgi:hypothetical protein